MFLCVEVVLPYHNMESAQSMPPTDARHGAPLVVLSQAAYAQGGDRPVGPPCRMHH
jgi:hypothetical protein